MRFKGFAVSVVLLLAVIGGQSAVFADEASVTVTFSYTDSVTGYNPANRAITVSAGVSEKYGFQDDYNGERPTVMDAEIAAAYEMFGDSLTEHVTLENGMVSFMEAGTNLVYFVDASLGSVGAGSFIIEDGESIALYAINDTAGWGDTYAWFNAGGVNVSKMNVSAGEALEVVIKGRWSVLYGMEDGDYAPKPLGGLNIAKLNESGAFGDVIAVTGESGEAVVTFDTPGTYLIAAYGADTVDVPIMSPLLTVIVHEQAAAQTNPHTGENGSAASAVILGVAAVALGLALARKVKSADLQ